MEITLSKDSINLFRKWLGYYSNPDLDATHTGIYSGVKYTLSMFQLYGAVTYHGKETTVVVDQEVINGVIEKHKKNKINAMMNVGFASGIVWVLEELGIDV